MNNKQWQAWAHIHHRALEGVANYDDGVKDKLNEDLKIIFNLLKQGEIKCIKQK